MKLSIAIWTAGLSMVMVSVATGHVLSTWEQLFVISLLWVVGIMETIQADRARTAYRLARNLADAVNEVMAGKESHDDKV